MLPDESTQPVLCPELLLLRHWSLSLTFTPIQGASLPGVRHPPPLGTYEQVHR